jgi:hypothetical protein
MAAYRKSSAREGEDKRDRKARFGRGLVQPGEEPKKGEKKIV